MTKGILTYDDRSCYIGEIRDGKKNGHGVLSTSAFVYSAMHTRAHSDNAHLEKWHEYTGNWVNDKLNGHGIHRQQCGNGKMLILFDGLWINGVPQATHEFEY